MFRVVITDCMAAPAAVETEILKGLASVDCLEAQESAELSGKLGDVDGVMLYHEVAINADLIKEMPKCRIIVRCGAGYDNVDLEAAGKQGIIVCNVPDYGVDEVADHAIGLLLAGARGILLAERRLRGADPPEPWDRDAVGPVTRVAGKTLGIIGCGRIGSATALRAKALKLNVIVYDPYLRSGIDKALGVEMVSLEALLKRSDYVSLHTPLTEETRHLIGAEALAALPTQAFLINTSRGEVVDATALAEALRAGQIRGAGIDVLPHEPPDSTQPLLQLWNETHDPPINLILTPHTAWFSDEAFTEMRTKGAAEIARVLSGEKPLNCVNQAFFS